MEKTGKGLNTIVKNFPKKNLELEKIKKLKSRNQIKEGGHNTNNGEVVDLLGKREKREEERKKKFITKLLELDNFLINEMNPSSVSQDSENKPIEKITECFAPISKKQEEIEIEVKKLLPERMIAEVIDWDENKVRNRFTYYSILIKRIREEGMFPLMY